MRYPAAASIAISLGLSMGGLMAQQKKDSSIADGGIGDPKQPAVVLPKSAFKKQPVFEAKLAKSVSISKVFTVYGERHQLRSAIAKMTDDIMSEFLKVVEEPNAKDIETPIVIVLQGKADDVVKGSNMRREFGPIEGGGFYVMLRVHVGKGVAKAEMRRGIMEMLLYERALRGRKSVDQDDELSVPPWMVDGFIEVLDWKNQRSERTMYNALKKKPQLFGVDRVVATTRKDYAKMDAMTKGAYRAAAGAMVLSLLEQPDGLNGMKEMLKELALHRAEISDLMKKHFPGLNTNPKALKKWWLIQIAQMAAPRMTDTLTLLETDERLEKLLQFQLVDPSGGQKLLPLADFEQLKELELEEVRAAATPMTVDIVQLNHRCFPEYRPLLHQYAIVAKALWNKKPDEKDIEELKARIARLKDEREKMKAAAIQGRDYIDWYVITSATEVKGDYRGFLKIKQQLEAEREAAKSKQLSPYLEVMQRFYSEKKSK